VLSFFILKSKVLPGLHRSLQPKDNYIAKSGVGFISDNVRFRKKKGNLIQNKVEFPFPLLADEDHNHSQYLAYGPKSNLWGENMNGFIE